MTDDKKKPNADELVRVKVKAAIAYEGLRIAPVVDASGRTSGRPAIVTAIEAVIPRRIAEAAGTDYVEILPGPPAPGARPGPAAAPHGKDRAYTGGKTK